jgi:hypothetical protein
MPEDTEEARRARAAGLREQIEELKSEGHPADD